LVEHRAVGKRDQVVGWGYDEESAIKVACAANVFAANTNYVLLSADTACHIAWTELGASAIVATSTNNLLLANTARLLRLAAQNESIDAFMMIGLALSVGIIVLVSLKIV
jgi:hypothetical protein